MEFSVAMCTYNGEKFIEQQLNSIASQTMLPKELVVCDDGSTDSTIQILRRFKEKACFDVRIIQNEATIRVAKNFEKAIGLCNFDVIVLSDQDDVWKPNRLERLASYYQDPTCNSVLNNATLVDEKLSPLGYSLWKSVGLSGRDRKLVEKGMSFEVLLRHDFVTGAAFSFRTDQRNLFFPIAEPWLHDEWMGFLLAARSNIILCPEELVLYRQHDTQQIGAKKRSIGKKMSDSVKFTQDDRIFFEKKLRLLRERLENSEGVDAKILVQLDQKLHHMKVRSDMMTLGSKKVSSVFSELLNGNYHRYSMGIKSAIRDLFF
jgi:glycosyltransferase involved in cell wall biosynthesis